ncbi:MAG: hypothetical protein EA361_19220 [Bacteroidetes bacterium]|nr:MAG: hypothetical protein EA361_19220 [Bacteroidota bacterium]
MKTSVITAIMAMFLFVAGAQASTKDVTDVQKPTEAARLLEKRISLPETARELKIDGYVAFELRVKEDKTIEYFQISANNQLLSESVQKQIKRLEPSLGKVLEPGETQRFKINFVVL